MFVSLRTWSKRCAFLHSKQLLRAVRDWIETAGLNGSVNERLQETASNNSRSLVTLAVRNNINTVYNKAKSRIFGELKPYIRYNFSAVLRISTCIPDSNP